MAFEIRTYDHETELDYMICKGKTLEEVIKNFEPLKKNYKFYYIRSIEK